MSTENYKKSLELSNLRKNLKKIKESGDFGNYVDMAAKLKITDQYLSDIVTGKRTPSERLIDTMAVIFSVQREKLLAEEDFIVADHRGGSILDEARIKLVEKVKRLVFSADDDVIDALTKNVDQFQEKSELKNKLRALEKK